MFHSFLLLQFKSLMMKKNLVEKTLGDGTTLIARNTELVGTVNFSGELEIEGRVLGDIVAVDENKAKIRVLEQGYVEGNISAPNVVINGRVKGSIFATKMLELSNKAVIDGNVHYDVIEMSKGAKINGALLYDTNPKKQSDNPQSKITPQAGK